jgi:hypothetical protein
MLSTICTTWEDWTTLSLSNASEGFSFVCCVAGFVGGGLKDGRVFDSR